MKHLPATTLSFVAFAAMPLFGETAATNTVAELEPVVVTASPIAKEERFTPDGAEVTFVGSDQTARLTAQDLPTALRHVPGVSISRYAPIGSYGGAQGGRIVASGTPERIALCPESLTGRYLRSDRAE